MSTRTRTQAGTFEGRTGLEGRRSGRLTAVRSGRSARGQAGWFCFCDCGKEVVVRTSDLILGLRKSCGCLRRERIAHGDSRRGLRTAEYTAWHAMIQRCHNSRNPNFFRYGARGIFVCDRWRSSFPNFLEDMGRKPAAELSLERVDNDRGYDPGNCKRATILEQSRNKRPRGTAVRQ